MSIRQHLETTFKAVDAERTGYMSKVELERLLKKLNPDLTAAEMEEVFSKLDTTRGKVKFNDFLDLFCEKPAQAPKEMKRELSKPMSREESAAMKKAFADFDKDKSGYIDLTELSAMCQQMGKKITYEQTANAMQQLDKNGDGRVTYDEFALWWTCTPGFGGYNDVVLGFLKGKLALQSKINNTFSRVVRKKLDNTDEFSFKANIDITPDKAGTNVQSSACVNMYKKRENEKGPPNIVIKLNAKNADAAAAINASIARFMAALIQKEPLMQKLVKATQETSKIVFTILLEEEWFDEDARQAISLLQAAAKQVELKLGLGTTFEEILENPHRPLCQMINGVVLGADLLVGLTSLVGWSREEMPELLMCAVRCFAGIMMDMKLAYNHPNLLAVAEKYKSILKMDVYTDEALKTQAQLMCKGIANARDKLYAYVDFDGSDGLVRNGKWSGIDDRSEMDTLDKGIQVLKELAKGCTGIESISLVRLPGATVEIVAKLDKINPFPMADYFFGHFPKPPPGYSKKPNDSSLKKPVSSDEVARLRGVFDKYDKDKSGRIDLKELKGMLEELGAKVDENELQEGMQELDRNGDGNCSFDEFKEWWSTKPHIQGYNSYALTVLRGQMKMASMVGRVKSGIGSATGYVGRTDNPDDTYIKFQQELTPGMIECQPKMISAVKLQKSSTTRLVREGTNVIDGRYDPVLTVAFVAKSVSDAKDVVEQFKLLFSSEAIKPMYEMMLMPIPQPSADGSNVYLKVAPGSDLVEQFYTATENSGFLQVASTFINAVLGSGCTAYTAVDFSDMLANSEKNIYTNFGGMKWEGLVRCTAEAKSLVLDAIRGMAPMTGIAFEQTVAFPIELAKLFQSLDVTFLLGYHKENFEKAMDMEVLDEFTKMSSPSALRELIANMAPRPEQYEMLEAAKKNAKIFETICNKLDSITSYTVDGIYLPGKEECMVEVSTTFTNVKPFDFWKYISEPVRMSLLRSRP